MSRYSSFRRSDGRYYLPAGLNSDGNATGEAFLTASQFQTLFGGRRLKAPKKLGCGVFACAYDQGPGTGKVVKITSDASDAASLVKAQGSPYVPKLYAAYKLRGVRPRRDGRDKPLFALVVEKLKPLAQLEKLRRPFRCLFGGFRVRPTVKLCCAVDLEGAVTSPTERKQQRACRKVLQGAMDAAVAVRARGIETNDVHVDNVGYGKDGVLKILDLGLSVTGSHNPKTLAGGKSRKR